MVSAFRKVFPKRKIVLLHHHQGNTPFPVGGLRFVMDCLTMVLVERETGLPLDLVVLINSFLCERLTDENFKQAIALWFENEEECKFRLSHQRLEHLKSHEYVSCLFKSKEL
jgi:hypothetical protein